MVRAAGERQGKTRQVEESPVSARGEAGGRAALQDATDAMPCIASPTGSGGPLDGHLTHGCLD